MIRKNGILEISDHYLTYKNLFKTGLINKIRIKRQGDVLKTKADCLEDIKVDLKNRNLFLVVHGEEVYVKYMVLPKVKKEKLYFLIKEELSYKFKKIDNIMVTYEIFKDNGTSLEVIVFCLNWNKSDIIKECVQKGAKIREICPVQFHILNNYKNKIEERNYILIFLLKDSLYFLACLDGQIIGNSVCKTFNKDKFIGELEKFKVKCFNTREFMNLYNLFFLDFPHKDLIEELSEDYHCIDLGCIDKENLVKV